MADAHCVTIAGWCPICEHNTTFVAKGKWYRSTLQCTTCENGSVPRERALAHVLQREAPHWRSAFIHESSPAVRGISLKLRRECKGYLASHFYADQPLGTDVNGYRNENVEQQTFPAESFDLVLSLDLTEHVFHPHLLFKEVYRTLRPGGLYISTFPIRKEQTVSHVQRAQLRKDGTIEHLTQPEYHGNPIDSKGALVTYDYGYTIHQMIPHWAPFAVEVIRFCDPHFGILGEYTEVIVCRKRLS